MVVNKIHTRASNSRATTSKGLPRWDTSNKATLLNSKATLNSKAVILLSRVVILLSRAILLSKAVLPKDTTLLSRVAIRNPVAS